VTLPSADDLFRPTAPERTAAERTAAERGAAERAAAERPAEAVATETQVEEPAEPRNGRRRPSGRVRHDEKMTVYITSEELLEVEHARLSLRRHHGLAVDRGRLVREALHLVLADLEAHGEDSALVRRLSEE
jgi:hypothetical protein